MEIERARLTRTLAKIKEDAGKIADAANILQELQVRMRTHPGHGGTQNSLKMALKGIWNHLNLLTFDVSVVITTP